LNEVVNVIAHLDSADAKKLRHDLDLGLHPGN
jgi:hypothetical protein